MQQTVPTYKRCAAQRKQSNSIRKRSRRKIVKSQSSQTQRELYYPDLFQYKKLDLDIQNKRVATGSWSLEQNKIYLQFLSKFKKDFSTEELRRKTVVFNRLSKELHKRTPDQCRSHHQKLQNRFNNDLDLIISFVQKKIKRKDTLFQLQRGQKIDKTTGPTTTRTDDLPDVQEGIEINFQELVSW